MYLEKLIENKKIYDLERELSRKFFEKPVDIEEVDDGFEDGKNMWIVESASGKTICIINDFEIKISGPQYEQYSYNHNITRFYANFMADIFGKEYMKKSVKYFDSEIGYWALQDYRYKDDISPLYTTIGRAAYLKESLMEDYKKMQAKAENNKTL